MSHASSAVSRIDKRVFAVISTLLVIAAGIILIRLKLIDFDLSYVIPQRVYTVDITQSFTGHGGPVDLSVLLPTSDGRQKIIEEEQSSADLRYETYSDRLNRVAKWSAKAVSGKRTVSYRLRLFTKAVRYEIDDSFSLADATRNAPVASTAPTKVIQSDNPEIVELARSLMPGNGRVLGFLKNVFDKVRALGFKSFKGTTDALTALRLGEASCNGKSRLMTALLRSQGLATRLVGGLVMTAGTKRTSHQWLEVWLDGNWIPMDPTNNHFGEIPHNYLILYRGDEVLFNHTADIGFKYQFDVKKRMVPRQEIDERMRVLGFWGVFKSLGIPLELLKSIMMIPLGALIVVIFRNVVGLRTFGTFLPVLIAVACRNSGLLWGLIGFVTIIFAVSLIRQLTSKLQLLHSPQLGVLLTAVIGFLLLAAALGEWLQLSGLAKVSLFPMVVVAITSERFSIMEIEENQLAAWSTTAQTLVVVSFCYLVMASLSLQIIILGFPELLLVVVALDIWIGRWVGLRASEFLRFKFFVLRQTPRRSL